MLGKQKGENKENSDKLGAKNKSIQIWLISVGVMILIAVGIGGFTRLQEAGLSIVEWRPITGIIPPLSHDEWEKEFEKYKKIEQWKRLHFWMTLSDFKKIYLIEYFHRLWGRFLGLAIIIPPIFFLLRRKLSSFWKKFYLALVVLVIIQGVIGWLMVRTGVVEERIRVNPLFLGFHNLFALFVYSFVIWGIWKASGSPKIISESRVKNLLVLASLLFLIQFFIGTLTAGERACILAPTYPDMNGELIPSAIFEDRRILLNFLHRHFGLLIFIPIVAGIRINPKIFSIPFLILVLQIVLGIITILNSVGKVPVLWGVIHQLNAWILFTSIIWELLKVRRT